MSNKFWKSRKNVLPFFERVLIKMFGSVLCDQKMFKPVCLLFHTKKEGLLGFYSTINHNNQQPNQTF